MFVKTYSMEDDWLHPDEVVTWNRGRKLTVPDGRSVIGAKIPEQLNVGQFTCDAGDNVLIIFNAVPAADGAKLASNLTTLRSGTNLHSTADGVNQIQVGLLTCVLGLDTANVIGIDNTSGKESRCFATYFNRNDWIDGGTPGAPTSGTVNSLTVASSNDVTPPYDAVFDSSLNTDYVGTDASLGTTTYDLHFSEHFEEVGSLRVIKWAAGNAPPFAFMNTAMEWMWYEWAIKNNPILYPPLRNYTN